MVLLDLPTMQWLRWKCKQTCDGGDGGVPFGSDLNHSGNYHPSLYYRSTYNEYWDGAAWSITGRLLCKVIGCNTAGSGFGGASGGGASNQGFIAGGITPSNPYTTTATQQFDIIPISGSFGRLVATTFHGDGSGLTNVLPSGLVTASAQLAADISEVLTKDLDSVVKSVVVNCIIWKDRS